MHGNKKISKVSVIIPAHNEEKNIANCLHSLFAQKIKPCEILLINDASTDNTDKIAKKESKNHKNLKIIKRKKSKGYTQVILTGIRYAKGDIIAILDADSIAPSCWIEKLIIAFKNVNVGCAGGPYFPSNTQKLIPHLENTYLKLRYSFKTAKSLSGTNLAFDLHKANKIKLFNKTPTFSIDKHIQNKMSYAGYSIKFDIKNPIFSRAPETITAYLKQSFRWGKGMQTLRGSNAKKVMTSTNIILLPFVLCALVIFNWHILCIYFVVLVLLTLSIYIKISEKTSIFMIPPMIFIKYLGLFTRSLGHFKFLFYQK